jgi:hypothetical protein
MRRHPFENRNPVQNGLVKVPKDWEYSISYRYVREEKYDVMWRTDTSLQVENEFERFGLGTGFILRPNLPLLIEH